MNSPIPDFWGVIGPLGVSETHLFLFVREFAFSSLPIN